MFAKLDKSKMWRLSTGTVVEQQMQMFALECNYEHPVHSMVLDISDKSWLKYFTPAEIQEIKNYEKKVLVDLPSVMEDYIKKLRECQNVATLKSMLKEELSDPGCEWIRSSVLQYIHLFKCGYLPLSAHTEGDILRRIWFFVDTAFDYSKIDCRGGEKASKSSSAGRNAQRVIAGEGKMESKRMGRKVDLLFLRQRLEYGCAECGRYENQTKELYDGSFKMLKVLKDMIYNLYKSAPTSLHGFTLIGFLMFETKFTLVTCDIPMGYVTRVTPYKSIDLPEEADDVNNQLLSILKAVYRARLTMEQTNRKVRKEVVEVDEQSEEGPIIISPSFNIEPDSNKRRRSSGESSEA